jgi:hypothetical protein
MRWKSLWLLIWGCGFLLTASPVCGLAGEMIVHNGGSMTIKTGSTLLLNCNDLTIESGGIFTLDGGVVEKVGVVRVASGGQYGGLSGRVGKCSKTFYVMPGINGKNAIIYF